MWCPSCRAPIPDRLLTCPACGSHPVDRPPIHPAHRSVTPVAVAGSGGCGLCGDVVPTGETVCVGCGEPLA